MAITLYNWVLFLFPLAVFLIAFLVFVKESRRVKKPLAFEFLAAAMGLFFIARAAIDTIMQYYAWKTGLSAYFLPPYQPIEYFIGYSIRTFWFNPIFTVVVALAFYRILKYFERKNSRFFGEGETELGLLMAIISGWQGFLLFLPLVLLSSILFNAIRLLIFKEKYTPIGYSFLLAGLLVLIFAGKFAGLLKLQI